MLAAVHHADRERARQARRVPHQRDDRIAHGDRVRRPCTAATRWLHAAPPPPPRSRHDDPADRADGRASAGCSRGSCSTSRSRASTRWTGNSSPRLPRATPPTRAAASTTASSAASSSSGWRRSIAVPLGIGCAIYLNQYAAGRVAGVVRLVTDVMLGHPDDRDRRVRVRDLGHQLRLLRLCRRVRASALVMVPLIVRATEEMLRLVPRDMREASLALGVTQVAHDRLGIASHCAAQASSPASCSPSRARWARQRRSS